MESCSYNGIRSPPLPLFSTGEDTNSVSVGSGAFTRFLSSQSQVADSPGVPPSPAEAPRCTASPPLWICGRGLYHWSREESEVRLTEKREPCWWTEKPRYVQRSPSTSYAERSGERAQADQTEPTTALELRTPVITEPAPALRKRILGVGKSRRSLSKRFWRHQTAPQQIRKTYLSGKFLKEKEVSYSG